MPSRRADTHPPGFRELAETLRAEGLLLAASDGDPPLAALTSDSRTAGPGSLFLALPGSQSHGDAHIPDALRRGAAALLVERPSGAGLPELVVRDAKRAAHLVARAWYRDPAGAMRIVGVTGTNGKTTTTALVRHLLNAEGDAGSIGTLGAYDGAGEEVGSTAGTLTTPGAVDLQATLAALRDRGVETVAMEASSHSLDQGRLDALAFAGALFTNLTRDHLDYHGTMEAYLGAKLRLLSLLAPGASVLLNRDDPAWSAVPDGPRTVTFGLDARADVHPLDLVLEAGGSRFRIAGRFGTAPVDLPLPGAFNVSNALGAAACALALGHPLDVVADRLGHAPQVPGRMERLADRPCVVLRDYAHTPDALRRALDALRAVTMNRLIVLFGCGGDRDRGKRPLMGQVVDQLADFAVVTSDNPRTEDPERIIDDIMPGITTVPHLRLPDRREAIARALNLSRPGDTLLLAGKGHETYQVIGTEKQPFDEREIVRDILGRESAS